MNEKEKSENNANNVNKWVEIDHKWKSVKVNDDETLEFVDDTSNWISEVERRKFVLRNKARGLIRSIVIVLDMSTNGLLTRDFGCSRVQLFKQSLRHFVTEFFEANPISQISFVATSNGGARRLSDLCGSLELHLRCIDNLDDYVEEGEPSIHNAMNISLSILKSSAQYSTREILMLYGSLHTCDITPIDPILLNLKSNKVVVNAIGFGAAVYILSHLSNSTGGAYFVPLSSEHLRDILMANIEPPIWSSGFERLEYIPFGFVQDRDDLPSFDLSDLRSQKEPLPKFDSLTCPKCNFHVFALPVYCPSCGLLLITPDHITRTKFHLQATPDFELIAAEDERCAAPCRACLINEKEMYRCTRCDSCFCKTCNAFMHTTLNKCPYCSLIKKTE